MTNLDDLTLKELTDIVTKERVYVSNLLSEVSYSPDFKRETLITLIKAKRLTIFSNTLIQPITDMDQIRGYFSNHSPLDDGIFHRVNMTFIEGVAKYQTDPGGPLDYFLSLEPCYINMRDKAGDTLLHMAVQRRNLVTIRILLNRGADPKIKNERGYSPFLDSIGNSEISILLLKNGADHNEYDKRGIRNAFSYAIQYNDVKLMEELLKDETTYTIPYSRHVIDSANNESYKTLLKYPQFYEEIFTTRGERSFFTRVGRCVSGKYMTTPMYFDALQKLVNDTPEENFLKPYIVEVKEIIAKCVFQQWESNPAKTLSRIEQVSVYDTIITRLGFLSPMEDVSEESEEGCSKSTIVILIYLAGLDQERYKLIYDGERREEIFFYRIPKWIPVSGSFYSWRMSKYVKTYKDFAKILGAAEPFLNLILEGEIVNNSDIEIEDGVALSIEIKPALTGSGKLFRLS